MSVISTAHEIPGGSNELNRIARNLFNRDYTTLTDSEAERVWGVIETREQSAS